MAKITVMNTNITVINYSDHDYISLTDMASAKAFAQTCLNLLLGREELQEDSEPESPILSQQTPPLEPMKKTLSRRELLGRYAQPLAVDLEQKCRSSDADSRSRGIVPEPITTGDKV